MRQLVILFLFCFKFASGQHPFFNTERRDLVQLIEDSNYRSNTQLKDNLMVFIVYLPDGVVTVAYDSTMKLPAYVIYRDEE